MKILYLINYDLNENSGVVNKIKQQVSIWRKENRVYLFSIKNLILYDDSFNIISQKQHGLKILNKRGKLFTFIRLLSRSYRLESSIKNIDFDIIYMRYLLYMPFLSQVIKKNRVIMEINSDDLLEYKLNSKITHYYNMMTRDKILLHVNGFVCVSHELKNKFLKYSKPIEVIANGINVEEYQYLLETKNEKPIFVFIGSPNQSWHGIDKIEKMAQYFKNYQFYIIGISKENSDNVKYLGYLSNQESTEIISKCDVGIGTLSLYKTALEEASPLKTRQYFACGLPVVYAYKDSDIEGKMDFCLKLKNSENNIEYHQIESFVEKVFGERVYRERARAFAMDKLDYGKKEKLRVAFFDRILNG